MNPTVAAMYTDAKQVHHLVYEDIVRIRDQFNESNLAEQVDVVYGLKKTAELLDDLRKELDKERKRLEILTCLGMYAAEAEKIKTPHCSAKVDVKQFAKFPHKRANDPDKFDTLMKAIGVPDDLIKSEAVRFNWQGFSDWFTYQQRNGLPLPEGITIDDVYTEYKLVCRKIKEVDEK